MSVSNSPAPGVRENANSIRVICRFRPPKQTEIALHGQSDKNEFYVIDDTQGTITTEIDFERKSFKFDEVFNVDATQAEIFESVLGIIDSVMEGFNGTILAYGQTSSGKTHTMEGPSLWDTSLQGVIPRTIDKLFQAISEADVHTAFTVSVSYFEVYCEKIRDLLNPSQNDLKMREVKHEGFVIQDITEAFCVDREGIIRIIEMGKTHRASAPTLMNAESSRSHSILSLLLSQKNETTGRYRKGKLFLVDLAGSEKVSKTGAQGARLEEAKKINSHVPYRDSKLSRILQDSLGGNSKTTLIICCAPEERHCSETLSTLRFGERAKRIKNNAKVNEELGVPELKKLLAIAQKEIASLKTQFAMENPSYLDCTPAVDATKSCDPESILSIDLLAEEEDEESTSYADEISGYRIRISELEESLEYERQSCKTSSQQLLSLQAEHEALKHTVVELESKILASSLDSLHQKASSLSTSRSDVESFELLSNETTPVDCDIQSKAASHVDIVMNPEQSPDFSCADQQFEDLSQRDRLRTDSSCRGKDESAEIESLRLESLQLRGLLVGEIESLENSLSAREEETKHAKATAAEYADKYVRLRQEHENQIQRLILKLSQEQHARIDVEDRLEETLQRLWSQQSNSGAASNRQSGNIFSKIFQSGGIEAPRALHGLTNMRRERELVQEVEKQQARISQMTASMESTKEAQRIVLETKESVMRSLLQQNVTVSQERDTLAAHVEELTSTVEQLTGLLRSMQSRSTSAIADRYMNVSKFSSVIQGGGANYQIKSLNGGSSNAVE